MKKYIKWYKRATVRCYIRSSITQRRSGHNPRMLDWHHMIIQNDTDIWRRVFDDVPVRRLAPEVRSKPHWFSASVRHPEGVTWQVTSERTTQHTNTQNTHRDEDRGGRGADGGSGAFSADAARQLDVFGHDGHTLGMDGAQVSVLEQTHQIRLAGLLQTHSHMTWHQTWESHDLTSEEAAQF